MPSTCEVCGLAICACRDAYPRSSTPDVVMSGGMPDARIGDTPLRRIANKIAAEVAKPIPMRIPCPECGELHIDGVFATKPHHTHACQHCGAVWRPAIVHTVGVRFLPGFRDADLIPDGEQKK